MARCAGCGKLILMGGVNTTHGRYCTEDCAEESRIATALEGVDPDQIKARVMAEHLRACPRCGRDGPVNVHRAVMIASFFIFTKFGEEKVVSCTRCARRLQLKAFFGTLLMGWWGIPIGLAGTPLFLLWNLVLIAFPPRRGHPRPEFVGLILRKLASEAQYSKLAEKHAEGGVAKPKFAARRPLTPPNG